MPLTHSPFPPTLPLFSAYGSSGRGLVRACCAKTFNELFPTFDQKSRELTAQRDKEGELKIAIDGERAQERGVGAGSAGN